MRTITLVCGPPCSGKTTYVREHAAPGDFILDLDAIAMAITVCDGVHQVPDGIWPLVWNIRDVLQATFPRSSGINAWVIDMGADAMRRARLESIWQANKTVVLITTEAICCERAKARGTKINWCGAIRKWWAEYTPAEGELQIQGVSSLEPFGNPQA